LLTVVFVNAERRTATECLGKAVRSKMFLRREADAGPNKFNYVLKWLTDV
jgi:hypothetical protein